MGGKKKVLVKAEKVAIRRSRRMLEPIMVQRQASTKRLWKPLSQKKQEDDDTAKLDWCSLFCDVHLPLHQQAVFKSLFKLQPKGKKKGQQVKEKKELQVDLSALEQQLQQSLSDACERSMLAATAGYSGGSVAHSSYLIDMPSDNEWEVIKQANVPQTAFALWLTDWCLRDKDKSQENRLGRAVLLWRGLSDAEKAPYQSVAENKERHALEERQRQHFGSAVH